MIISRNAVAAKHFLPERHSGKVLPTSVAMLFAWYLTTLLLIDEPAVSSVAKRTLLVREVCDSIPRPVKVSLKTRHRCDVS